MHAAYRQSAATGEPVDEVFERRELSRRDFLARSSGAALSAAVPLTLFGGCAHSGARDADVSRIELRFDRAGPSAPRVAIIGGGLAGVTCAYRLRQAGIASTIYEAGGGLGGRTWTLRGFFEQGQTAENGGEFISTEHVATRKLAAELGLTLDDLRAWDDGRHTSGDVYWVHGQRYPIKQMLADYGAVYPKLERDNSAAGIVRYDRHNQAGYKLDHTSAHEWLERNVPGGLQSNLGWLLDLNATTENGGESTEQNSLEFIYMLADMPSLNPKGGFYLVGTDERYRVREGNDQMVARMARTLPADSINSGTRLTALSRRADGSYLCTLSNPQRTFDAAFDHVVLALPFKTLRDCDLSRAGFSPVKMAAIRQLPMGTNIKLHVQFTSRVWLAHGSNGATYSDTGYQQTWEDTRAQSGSAGVLIQYNGGHAGAAWNAPSFGPADPSFVRGFFKQLEPLYPGIGAQWNGKAFLDNWPKDRWHRGSYSYWGLGNSTTFVGIEPVRQGNVHFCGEHCSVQFGGFMNGAVETGEAAAREVMHDVKGAAAAALIGARRAV